jgi:hypothetical protein
MRQEALFKKSGWMHRSLVDEKSKKSAVIPDSVFADPESSISMAYWIPGHARHDGCWLMG